MLLKQVWETTQRVSGSALRYSDFKILAESVEPNLTVPEVKRFFITANDISHSCTQTSGVLCPVMGTVENGEQYGGDIISYRTLFQAALKCNFFLQDHSHGDGAQTRIAAQSPR